ncbi:unnamed protein product [Musa acuminata subsp. malaccensis]|uniref:(wild Malaysian banana) hypothetical protein n=1 Tax=Musa acuminata subsp. malaccensis TaxID=214687 RepID=A0A804IDW4_MUSAM|nr:unnamed protein product [Musa acuminata subsp. malaccensis]
MRRIWMSSYITGPDGSLDGRKVTRNQSAEHKNVNVCVELLEDMLDLKGLLIILNNQVRDVVIYIYTHMYVCVYCGCIIISHLASLMSCAHSIIALCGFSCVRSDFFTV